MERAAPVVEGVEEPVLEHCPARIAVDTPVIRVRALVGGRPVPQRRAASDAAWHPSAQKERSRKGGIHEARQVPDPREPARASPKAIGLDPLTGQQGSGHLGGRCLRRHVQESAARRTGHQFANVRRVQLTRARQRVHLSIRVPLPERRVRQVGADLHRKERLTPCVADDRLVPAQQLQVGGGAGLRLGAIAHWSSAR
jgi:hypothetical protein